MHKPEQILLPLDIAGLAEKDNQTSSRPKLLTCKNTTRAKEYGVQVVDVCEAYTSKTVSWTGEIVANLGGSKVIKSSEGHRMDRDLNGARGIFIKNVARALTVRPCLA